MLRDGGATSLSARRAGIKGRRQCRWTRGRPPRGEGRTAPAGASSSRASAPPARRGADPFAGGVERTSWASPARRGADAGDSWQSKEAHAGGQLAEKEAHAERDARGEGRAAPVRAGTIVVRPPERASASPGGRARRRPARRRAGSGSCRAARRARGTLRACGATGAAGGFPAAALPSMARACPWGRPETSLLREMLGAGVVEPVHGGRVRWGRLEAAVAGTATGAWPAIGCGSRRPAQPARPGSCGVLRRRPPRGGPGVRSTCRSARRPLGAVAFRPSS